jgi:hypothetical protein
MRGRKAVAVLLALTLSSSAMAASGEETFGLPTDKVLHASISACLALGLTGLLVALHVPKKTALWLGPALSFGVGIGKEVVDLATTPSAQRSARLLDSVGDLAFDALGDGSSLVAVALTMLPEQKPNGSPGTTVQFTVGFRW